MNKTEWKRVDLICIYTKDVKELYETIKTGISHFPYEEPNQLVFETQPMFYKFNENGLHINYIHESDLDRYNDSQNKKSTIIFIPLHKIISIQLYGVNSPFLDEEYKE